MMTSLRVAILVASALITAESFSPIPNKHIIIQSISTLAFDTQLFAERRASSKSALKRRQKKRRGGSSGSRNGKSRSLSSIAPISEEQMQDHVSDLYIHGPGGVLRPSKDEKYSQLDKYPALVLNADYLPLSYLPLSVWSWQDAVKAVFTGKVTVVETYQVKIRATKIELPLPSVMALNEYAPSMYTARPAFTKRNVFLRDEYTCQYCRNRFHTRDLSLDHVVPRCRGGKLTWDNTVTSCRACNGRKGSYDVRNLPAGMQLWRPPRIPTQHELAAVSARLMPRKVHPTWEPYLGAVNIIKTNEKPSPRGKTMREVVEASLD